MAEKLGLIKKTFDIRIDDAEKITQKHKAAFEGVGKLKNFQCTLSLRDQYVGKINPCRSIPFALRDKVKTELDRMVHKGIAKKVDVSEHVEFVSNLVVVRKSNGKVRLCLDPGALNKAIKHGSHPMKKFEEISAQLVGSKFFTTLDANQGFWQIEMNENSSKLCTFITPWGRYRFLRMPFGIACASDVFQAATDKIFGDMKNVMVVIDDILIHSETEDEHSQTL